MLLRVTIALRRTLCQVTMGSLHGAVEGLSERLSGLSEVHYVPTRVAAPTGVVHMVSWSPA